MKAVVLAAGTGTRLGEHAQGRPKCLLEIGGATLIERSLTNLAAAGIDEAIIVLGFRGDDVVARIGDRYRGIDVVYARNPVFDRTGNMYSLAQAEQLLDADTMILEGDLIYQADAIPRLLDAEHADVILTGRLLHHGDDVLIVTDDRGRITDLGKGIDARAEAAGALLGISKFSHEFMRKLFEHAKRDFARGETNYHYEETVLATSRTGHPVHALVCHDLNWTEIDNEEDLKRARDVVYPAIRDDNSNESSPTDR